MPSSPLRPEIPLGRFIAQGLVSWLRTPSTLPAPTTTHHQPLPGCEKEKVQSPPGLLCRHRVMVEKLGRGFSSSHAVLEGPRPPPRSAEAPQEIPAQPAPSPWGLSWKDLQRTWPFLSERQEGICSQSQFNQPHGWKEFAVSLNNYPLMIYTGATVRRPQLTYCSGK